MGLNPKKRPKPPKPTKPTKPGPQDIWREEDGPIAMVEDGKSPPPLLMPQGTLLPN